MPMHDFHDFARNVSYSFQCLKREVLSLVALMTNKSVAYMVGITLLAVFRMRSWRSELERTIVLAAVGVSFFVFSIPLAPVIQTRSLVAMSVAIILWMLVPASSRRDARWISMILLILVGWNMAIHAHAFMVEQKEQTEFVLSKLEGVLPHDPTSYKAIALFGNIDTRFADAAIVNSPPRMRAVVLASGVPEFWDCRSESQVCEQLKANLDVTARAGHGGIEFAGTYNDVAVIYAAR